MGTEVFEHPLTGRYASQAMRELFSAQRKFSTWRRLWVALAEAERDLGLPITDAQLAQMRAVVDDIDFEAAQEREREVRHDVMAHVHTFARQAPLAAPIIHLGATSCYVTDNTELMQMRDGLRLIAARLAGVIGALADFARRYKDLVVLGHTHFQPAQPTTVGKRATLWIADLVMDLERVEREAADLRLRGAKGTTGTQHSFMELFQGDAAKVDRLEAAIARAFDFPGVYPVTGQTYSRKVDFNVLSALAGVAQSAHKFANDVRLLSRIHEIEEPFESEQIGSSAMPYKRNPMRCERMTGLARYAIALLTNAAQTAAEQWLERTLDDSANRRLVIPEMFLTIDAILQLYANVAKGLTVHEKAIARNLADELPFMATESILMAAVERGGHRQDLHERLRRHAMAARKRVVEDGAPNDFLGRLAADPAFAGIDLAALTAPARLAGRAAEQTETFLTSTVAPILQRYPASLGRTEEVRV
jgi:adenylosuccinate lyase